MLLSLVIRKAFVLNSIERHMIPSIENYENIHLCMKVLLVYFRKKENPKGVFDVPFRNDVRRKIVWSLRHNTFEVRMSLHDEGPYVIM